MEPDVGLDFSKCSTLDDMRLILVLKMNGLSHLHRRLSTNDQRPDHLSHLATIFAMISRASVSDFGSEFAGA